MKKLQKPIAAIIIIGLVLSLSFNLFIFKPKQVQAFDVIGGPWNIPQTLKEIVLDTIAHTITQTILNVLEQKIMNWGLGRKSTANVPFAVTDWVQFFRDAAIRGAAKFINEEYENLFDSSNPCEMNLKGILDSLGFNIYPQDLTYSQYARPTLTHDLTTCLELIDSGYSIVKGGWNSWFSLMEPQNNVFGQAMMAEQERYRQMTEEKEAAKQQTGVSGGYKNEEVTTQTDAEACNGTCTPGPSPIKCGDDPTCETELFQGAKCLKGVCAMPGSVYWNCVQNCENKPGVAIQTKIKNLGSNINKLMTNALGADMNRLINTSEITQLLGVIYSALMNKAISGLGLDFSAQTSKKSEKTRAETKTAYSYQKAFKKEQTIEDIKDVRSEILSNILKAIQQLSKSVTTCKDDELMKYDDYSKNLADIFSGYVEALYIGLDGVNLKPDFEVLDPVFAPYTVYGHSWGQVPAAKFPDKCKAITDQLTLGDNTTCRSIQSGLEPNIHPQCQTCMYDHDSLNCPPAPYPPQPYPKTGQPDPWGNETLMKQKSDYWWECRNQYNVTLDRCGECLKNVDEKCQEIDPLQKNQCIINQCGNFSDISNNIVTPLPADPDSAALEFYNRCVKEEAKDACFTCLKEYFMPATYCDQTQDYMARSIIKYPTLVKKVRNNAPDHEIWLGPYDKIMGEQGGGECDNNDEAESIDLAIICRIMPDFKYAGQKICETQCSHSGLTGQALTDALKDITDFRPNGKDCNGLSLPIGGKATWNPINDGVFYMRGKCCGALWQGDAAKYAACVGGGTIEEPEEPAGACSEGYVFIGGIKTTQGKLFKCPEDGDCYQGKGATSDKCRRGCSDFEFTVPDMENIDAVEVRTNPAPGGSIVTVAQSGCSDNDESKCIAGGAAAAKAMLIDKLAKIFKPLMPYAAYAQGDCNCNSRTDCAEGERCKKAGTECRDDPSFSGICEEAPITGTCNCNTNADCSVSGQNCDTEASANGDCLLGTSGFNGLCTEGEIIPPGPDLGNCDYVGQEPNTTVPGDGPGGLCQMEVYNSVNSESCCASNPKSRIGKIGKETMICDFSDFVGQKLTISVVSNDFSDCKTSSGMCVSVGE